MTNFRSQNVTTLLKNAFRSQNVVADEDTFSYETELCNLVKFKALFSREGRTHSLKTFYFLGF